MFEPVAADGNEMNARIDRIGSSSLTAAHILLVLNIILAAVLRLSGLADAPLSLDEAGQALAVWQFWQPAGESLLPSASPAYFSLSSLLMLVLGDSDAVARLIPAFAGIGVVIMPWLLRRRIGVAGALTSGLLLAVSPTLTALSRTAGGDSIALFAGLLMLIAWVRFQDEGKSGWLYLAAGALGLGLVSSALFLTILSGLALAWVGQHYLGPRLNEAPHKATSHEKRYALLCFTLSLLAFGTMMLWNLPGLGDAASALGAWVQAFLAGGGISAWTSPLLALLRYEPALVVLGIPALAWTAWRGRSFSVLLLYWFVVGLLLALLQHKTMAAITPMVGAAYLLIGVWAQEIFQAEPDEEALAGLPFPARWLRWGLFATLLIAAAVFTFNLGRYLRVSVFTPEQWGHLLLAIVAVVVAIALVNLVRAIDRAIAAQSTLLALLVILTLYGWGTAWWLGHRGANDPRERWVSQATDDEVRLMTEILAEASLQTANSASDISLVSGVDNPVLRWYLRDIHLAQFSDANSADADIRAIITSGPDDLNLDSDYFGADFGLFRRTSGEMQTASVPEILKWWLFHESVNDFHEDRIFLWLRTDSAIGVSR